MCVCLNLKTLPCCYIPQVSLEGSGSTPAPSESTPAEETTASMDATVTELPVATGDKTPSDAPADEDVAGTAGETKPATSATVATDTASSASNGAVMDTAAPLETSSAPADLVGVGTSSQDEEEGVSDVESEKSQEPSVKAGDVSEMAARLLDVWKDLKVSPQTSLLLFYYKQTEIYTSPPLIMHWLAQG